MRIGPPWAIKWSLLSHPTVLVQWLVSSNSLQQASYFYKLQLIVYNISILFTHQQRYLMYIYDSICLFDGSKPPNQSALIQHAPSLASFGWMPAVKGCFRRKNDQPRGLLCCLKRTEVSSVYGLLIQLSRCRVCWITIYCSQWIAYIALICHDSRKHL